MIDKERRDLHAFLLKNHAFSDFGGRDFDAFSGEFLVDVAPNPDVEIERLLDVLHHVLRAGGPPDSERRLATLRTPSCQVEVWKSDDVIRVKVRQKDIPYLAQKHADLRDTDAGAAAAVEEQSLTTGLDENAWSESFWVGVRPAAGSEHRHCDVGSRALALGLRRDNQDNNTKNQTRTDLTYGSRYRHLPPRELRAEMAPQECNHRLQLVVVLSCAREEGVVAASFVVVRLNSLPVLSQRCFEVPRQRHLCIDAPTIGWSIRGAVQDEHRRSELRCMRHRPIPVAGRMQHHSLDAAHGEQILKCFAAATRMAYQAEPISAYAGEPTGGLHQRIDVLRGFGVGVPLQRRNARTWEWRLHEISPGPASSGKPAARDRDKAASR